MKRFILFLPFAFIFLATTTPTAFGQKGCDFNIVGTWKAQPATWKSLSSREPSGLYYRFGPEGAVSVLSAAELGRGSDAKEMSVATFSLDNAKAPKRISFVSRDGAGALTPGETSMEVTAFGDTSFRTSKPGSAPIRWLRVDPFRYFLVLAGRRDVFYDGSGPAFPMLIRTDGQKTDIEAIGIFSLRGNASFGAIPVETYTPFLKETSNDSEVMLRLEISAAQYERSLKILKSWDRRVRNDELLYVDPHLDNILLLKQVSESLNQCGETVKLYKLDWGIEDYISDRNIPSRTPFLFFKEMKRRNEALHVRDEKFYGARQPSK